MNIQCRGFFSSLTIALLFFFSVSAENQAGDQSESRGGNVLKALQTLPKLEVEFNRHSLVVTEGFDIYVTVINFASAELIPINLRIIMPPAFKEARRAQGNSRQDINSGEKTESPEGGTKTWDSSLTSKDQKTMSPGASKFFNFHVPQEKLSFWTSLFNSSLLMFQPAEYEIRVVLIFKLAGNDNPIYVQEKSKLVMEPSIVSPIWGGVFGSLLLTLFVTVYRYRRPRTDPSAGLGLQRVAVSALTGVMSAVITMLLIYRLKDLALPISLDIKDFYGGLIVGLFTYRLGDWLSAKLFAENGNQIEDKQGIGNSNAILAPAPPERNPQNHP